MSDDWYYVDGPSDSQLARVPLPQCPSKAAPSSKPSNNTSHQPSTSTALNSAATATASEDQYYVGGPSNSQLAAFPLSQYASHAQTSTKPQTAPDPSSEIDIDIYADKDWDDAVANADLSLLQTSPAAVAVIAPPSPSSNPLPITASLTPSSPEEGRPVQSPTPRISPEAKPVLSETAARSRKRRQQLEELAARAKRRRGGHSPERVGEGRVAVQDFMDLEAVLDGSDVEEAEGEEESDGAGDDLVGFVVPDDAVDGEGDSISQHARHLQEVNKHRFSRLPAYPIPHNYHPPSSSFSAGEYEYDSFVEPDSSLPQSHTHEDVE